MSYDLIVIGGGPAGYVGAIRAAQLGKRVVCVERERVGGTCLNWGCIPTKALLKNGEVYNTINKRAAEFGIATEGLSVDWETVIGRSRQISDRLSAGISFLFKKNKIESVAGEASIPGPGKVEVTAADGTVTTLEAPQILIATGARTREVPVFPFNGKTIIGSKDALVMKTRPGSMIVIGSGAIGSELSYVYHCFGTKVTLVEALPRILPNEDDDVSQAVERSFKKQGITCMAGAKVDALKDNGDSVTATITAKNGKVQEITADVCLVAIGVVPVVPVAAGLELTERGFIKVNERYETSIPGVYAVGDCIGGIMLAHTASYEAEQAVEGMYVEGHTPKQAVIVPGCTYCHPQVASVGKRERELKEAGVEYKVGKFPFQAIGRAVAGGDTEGFVKLLFGKENGELLGAHIVGDNATELLTAPELALNSELTEADLNAMIYAHPTLSEAIHEAVLAADGRAIHA
ncbi:MAG: dihydrolipoyl dehydrogenase [Akkermansiaceae bacterium]|nr:dihydrolipoyl dehydrogenase [Akkermansiaceae bacterium]